MVAPLWLANHHIEDSRVAMCWSRQASYRDLTGDDVAAEDQGAGARGTHARLSVRSVVARRGRSVALNQGMLHSFTHSSTWLVGWSLVGAWMASLKETDGRRSGRRKWEYVNPFVCASLFASEVASSLHYGRVHCTDSVPTFV